MLDYQATRIHALEGRKEEALMALRKIITTGRRFWYIDGAPALGSLQGTQEFQSIVGDRDMLVVQEQARLANF